MERHPQDVLACIACALHHTCSDTRGPYAGGGSSPSPIEFALPQLIVRFHNYRPLTPLKSAVKAISLGKFVSVTGTVVRTSPTRPAVERMDFTCSRCSNVKHQTFQDNIYQPPNGCEQPCQQRFMEPDRLTAQCVDQQTIKIQEMMHGVNYNAGPGPGTLLAANGAGSTLTELPDSAASSSSASTAAALSSLEDQGRVPRTLEVLLIGADLVDSVIPGDIVTVSGFIKSRKQDHGQRGKNASVFVLYLEANDIDKASSQSQDSIQTEEYATRFLTKKEEEGLEGGGSSASTASSTLLKQPSPYSKMSAASSSGLVDFSLSELTAIHQLAESSQSHGIDLLKMLVASICPTIFGHEVVKAGLLLALLGGVTKHGTTETNSNASSSSSSSSHLPSSTAAPGSSARSSTDPSGATTVRGDIHVLLVGDPGLGKSQMLRATSKASPRGVYISGGVTSKTGLTVTMVRDGKDGDFALEAGALVLADQGCCCIDGTQHNKTPETTEKWED